MHLYTGLGLVAAAGIAILLVRGGTRSFRDAFLLMLAAVLVDATDGLLARTVGVKRVLPGFDGRRLDDIIDFLTYTFLPLLVLWRAEVLPAGSEPWLLAPLLASAYGFCQVEAKSADGYFIGFPSYWNLVAFYLYVLDRHVAPLSGWLVIGTLVGLAVLTFVPSRYLYPSQGGRLGWIVSGLGAVWGSLLLWILFRLPTVDPPSPDPALRLAILVSLSFPAFYLGASWLVSWRLRRDPRQSAAQ